MEESSNGLTAGEVERIILDSYEALADSYNQKARKTGYTVPAWLKDNIPTKYKTGLYNCLDLACGTGHLAQVIHQINHGILLSGVDISRNMLREAARTQLYQALLRLNIKEQLPFQKESFDLMVGLGVFELIKDPEITIERCLRHLKPDGHFLFSLQEYEPGHFQKPRIIEMAEGFSTRGHTISEAETLCRNLGLTEVKISQQAGYTNGKVSCHYLMIEALKAN